MDGRTNRTLVLGVSLQNGPLFVLSIRVFVKKTSRSKNIQSFEDQDHAQRQKKNDHCNEKNWAFGE